MAHNQKEIEVLEELLFKRDQAIEALTRAVQAYRYRLHSYGIDIDINDHVPPSPPKSPLDSASCSVSHFDLLLNDYTQFDHHPLGVSPPEQLQYLNRLISHLERKSSSTFCEVMDKRVILGQWPCHPDSGLEHSKSEEFPSTVDCVPDCGGKDYTSDKVYTVDAVHKGSDNCISKPRDIQNNMGAGGGIDEDEIKELYMRLQALEADRESMRQSLLSLNIDNAELVLLKEIARKMCEEGDPERRVAKEPPTVNRFSFMSMIKMHLWAIRRYCWLIDAPREVYQFKAWEASSSKSIVTRVSSISTAPTLETQWLLPFPIAPTLSKQDKICELISCAT